MRVISPVAQIVVRRLKAYHDLRFDSLPSGWKDAPHFGNALLGSMLYVRDDKLCLEVFRADVCDHRAETHGWTAYSRPHFCIGYFTEPVHP